MVIIWEHLKKQYTHCGVCDKNKKDKNRKISYIFEKKLVLSIICSKFGSKDEKIFKEEQSIKILKILGLINSIEQYQNISQKKT